MTEPPTQNKYLLIELVNHHAPNSPPLPFLLASPRQLAARQLADGRPGGDQLVVRPLQGHELVVRSLLDHVASRHDGDDVRVLDGGEAVGDDDAGATFSGFVQRVLDRLAGERETEEKKSSIFVVFVLELVVLH